MSMNRFLPILLLTIPLIAADEDPVFRSDVSLVRVDAQVLDSGHHTVTGLRREDFILKDNGQPREIRNFANEEMPVDLLFLLDVSGSMRPHVERIANAWKQALQVMGEQDRVAIMVFDTYARIRMPFKGVAEVDREFQSLLRQETFNGGTEITRSLIQAALYVGKNGRKEARRAIVILTDDETGGARDEPSVERALTNAQAVLSALIAPDAMAGIQGRFPGGGGGGGRRRQGSGSTWPGSGGGGGLGGIILGGPLGGPPIGGGGSRYPQSGGGGPVNLPGGGTIGRGSRTQSAGTAQIARDSGGDSLQVEDASALEDTLARIRQRYSLHFHLPEGSKPGEERNIEVTLAANAARRYPDSTVRYRRVYVAPGGSDERPTITRTPHRTPGELATKTVDPVGPNETESVSQTPSSQTGVSRRRAAISEPDGPRGVYPTKPAPESTEEQATPPAPQARQPQSGGWRVLKPGEKP